MRCDSEEKNGVENTVLLRIDGPQNAGPELGLVHHGRHGEVVLGVLQLGNDDADTCEALLSGWAGVLQARGTHNEEAGNWQSRLFAASYTQEN